MGPAAQSLQPILVAVPPEQDGDDRPRDPRVLRGDGDLLDLREQGRPGPDDHDGRPAPRRPVAQVPARDADRRHLGAVPHDRGGADLVVRRPRGRVHLDGARHDHRDVGRLQERGARRDLDADHRRLPGAPLARAGDRPGGDVRSELLDHHHHHRADVVGGHRPPGARPGALGQGTHLHRALTGARRERRPRRDQAHHPEPDARDLREHDPHDRDRDPVRIAALLPRLGRPQVKVVGHDDRRGVQPRRADPARLVVADGAEPVDRARGPRIHDGRLRDGRDREPEDPRDDERPERRGPPGHLHHEGRRRPGGPRRHVLDREGRGSRPRRRIRVRQVHDRGRDLATALPRHEDRGHSRARGRGHPLVEARAPPRGPLDRCVDHLPRRAARAEPGPEDRRSDRGGDPGPRDGHLEGGRRPRRRAPRAGRPAAAADRRLPARAVGRSEAARDDRDGPRVQPDARDRRRAHHGARRDGAGTGAAAAAVAPERPRPGDAVHHPRPLRARRRLGPAGDHVRRQDRRGRQGGRGLPRARSTPTPRRSRRRSPRSATRASATTPRASAATRPTRSRSRPGARSTRDASERSTRARPSCRSSGTRAPTGEPRACTWPAPRTWHR